MAAVEHAVTVRMGSVVNTMVRVWRPPDAPPHVRARTVALMVVVAFVAVVPPE